MNYNFQFEEEEEHFVNTIAQRSEEELEEEEEEHFVHCGLLRV